MGPVPRLKPNVRRGSLKPSSPEAFPVGCDFAAEGNWWGRGGKVVGMASDPSFDDLMVRLREGQNDAATQVFSRFAGRLIALARSHLGPQIRQKVDPEDVMQSVLRSFFIRNAEGQFGEFESWDNLWALLVVLTLRKCGRRIDYFHAACRDINREVSTPIPWDTSNSDWGLSAPEPTPSEAAMLTDTVEQLMNNLEGRHRQILSLSLQGCAPGEISSQVGCTERTVYRVLETVKEWLEAVRVEEE
jgi:RNA polymerase sigma-70 factor (ECF subfamily)